MSDGTISGNNAENYGGGVFVYNSGKFTMSDGTISGNNAEDYGGGVYVRALACS
jgi:parallel beta-helix repeat protein